MRVVFNTTKTDSLVIPQYAFVNHRLDSRGSLPASVFRAIAFPGKAGGEKHGGILRLGAVCALVVGGTFHGGDNLQQRHTELGY